VLICIRAENQIHVYTFSENVPPHILKQLSAAEKNYAATWLQGDENLSPLMSENISEEVVSLPEYPFERTVYWLSTQEGTLDIPIVEKDNHMNSKIL